MIFKKYFGNKFEISNNFLIFIYGYSLRERKNNIKNMKNALNNYSAFSMLCSVRLVWMIIDEFNEIWNSFIHSWQCSISSNIVLYYNKFISTHLFFIFSLPTLPFCINLLISFSPIQDAKLLFSLYRAS